MAPARDFIVVVFTNCRSEDSSTALALDDVAGLLVSRYSGAAASGPWIEAPTVLPLRLAGNNFTFDYLTLPGVSYVVETSSDLTSWSPGNGTNGQMATSLESSYADTPPGARRFFRVKAVP
jgi:hypothetical protein